MYKQTLEQENAVLISVEKKALREKVASIPRLEEKLRSLLESKEIIYYFEEHLISKVSKFGDDILSIDGKAYFDALVKRDNLWENLNVDVIASLLQESIASWTKLRKVTEHFPLENILFTTLTPQFVKGVIDTMAMYVERVHEEIKEKEYSMMLQNAKQTYNSGSRSKIFKEFEKKKDNGSFN